eukprot:679749-Rhodomonas_salina.1
MVAFVNQIRDDHVKGQLEAFRSRSGSFQQNDVRVEPPTNSSVRPAAAHILVNQLWEPIPHGGRIRCRGEQALNV